MEMARTKLADNGRIVIPASVRQALEFEPGEELLLIVEDDELRVTTMKRRAERAQRLVREHANATGSVVDELIADRRREALSE
jgi:AbrB family looped-hinge helix DNA binding protein